MVAARNGNVVGLLSARRRVRYSSSRLMFWVGCVSLLGSSVYWQIGSGTSDIIYSVNTVDDRKNDKNNAPEPAHEPEPSTINSLQSQTRQLQFSDFTLDKYMSHGGTAVIFHVTPPEWTFEALQLDKKEKFIMKVLDAEHDQWNYASIEIEAFRKMNQDAAAARKAGVLNLIYSAKHLENPFYCHHQHNLQNEACMKSPPGLKQEYAERIQKPTHVHIEVMPLAKPDFVFDKPRSMQEYITFTKSLLEQLALAHKLGINCQDLNASSNFFVRQGDGGAVLFDWNAGSKQGGPAYGLDRGLHMCPPEGLAFRVYHKDVPLYKTGSADIWQVGLFWVRILYRPCVWASDRLIDKADLLRETIRAIGGNTVIPARDGKEIDMADLVNLPLGGVKVDKFRPLLTKGVKSTSWCKTKTSWYLDDDSVPQEKKDQAMDFMLSMLKLSPYERASADDLLKHPFLNSS
eukprot:scaffold2353_cov167-Amphora_coffeaeformis.AAC.56